MDAEARCRVHYRLQVSSTQDEAQGLLCRGEAEIGDIVVADRQTAGRGRFGRMWASPHGGLYATYVCRNEPLLSLKSGVATALSLQDLGLPVRLKWPNDVLLGERKIAGILIEAVGDVALVGIGVNLEAAPLPTATAVACHGRVPERRALACAIGRRLMRADERCDILESYRRLCATLGRRVRVQAGIAGGVEGTATDIDPEGRLVVRTGLLTHAVSGGECAHLIERGAV